MANPSNTHWQVVKWILRYLKCIIDTCLEFCVGNSNLVGYADSDYVEISTKRGL